jgi:hypothetical protein
MGGVEVTASSIAKFLIINNLTIKGPTIKASSVYDSYDKTKLKNNESTGPFNKQVIPFFGKDDAVDIHANTLSILNDLLSYTKYAVTNFDIDGGINCEAFKDRFENGLAGWVATFDLTTHNDRPRCLYNLLPE